MLLGGTLHWTQLMCTFAMVSNLLVHINSNESKCNPSETFFQDVTLPARRLNNSQHVKPPPASWRPELVENERKCQWEYAAGLNTDGSEKTSGQHGNVRYNVLRANAIHVISQKDENDITDEDRVFLFKVQDQTDASYSSV